MKPKKSLEKPLVKLVGHPRKVALKRKVLSTRRLLSRLRIPLSRFLGCPFGLQDLRLEHQFIILTVFTFAFIIEFSSGSQFKTFFHFCEKEEERSSRSVSRSGTKKKKEKEGSNEYFIGGISDRKKQKECGGIVKTKKIQSYGKGRLRKNLMKKSSLNTKNFYQQYLALLNLIKNQQKNQTKSTFNLCPGMKVRRGSDRNTTKLTRQNLWKWSRLV